MRAASADGPLTAVGRTDGLVERAGAHFDDQLAPLDTVVDAACGQALDRSTEQIAAEVMQALVPEPEKARDDVCLLVVRRAP